MSAILIYHKNKTAVTFYWLILEITHAPCIQDALLTVGIFRNYIDDENMLRLKSLYRLAFVSFRLV